MSSAHVSPAPPIRVLIVEDSHVVRLLLQTIIARDPRLAVVAAVSSGEEALEQLETAKPDVISMDIRLPGIDGIETTRRIMAHRPTPIVVIAASVEDEALQISMNALRAGALSVVEKPPGPTHEAYREATVQICTQLVIMSQVRVIRHRLFDLPRRYPGPPRSPAALRGRPQLVAIAASTGGPAALARVLGGIPADFPLPILVVQHMGAAFLAGFAAWLDGVVASKVALAGDLDVPAAGRIYVAPGDRHLVGAGGALRLTDEPALRGQRPSATVLFRSLAESMGGTVIGVLLTGMGDDGAQGLAELRAAGSYTIAEDESTAIVYGMPGAAVSLGAVDEVLPLDAIAPRVVEIVQRERAPSS